MCKYDTICVFSVPCFLLYSVHFAFKIRHFAFTFRFTMQPAFPYHKKTPHCSTLSFTVGRFCYAFSLAFASISRRRFS